MDVSFLNSRKKAEEGVFLALKHPYTDVPLGEGEKAPGFLIRGEASPSAQKRMAEMQKNAEKADADDQGAVLEEMHKSFIDTALDFIIEARNLENEGKAVSTPDEIRAVLDMTFPEMGATLDENGSPIMQEIKGKDGETISAPKFELKNKTFAMQVNQAASDGQRFLGEMPKG